MYLITPDGGWIDLHPFVVFDETVAFVLAELRKRAPVLWRPLTGEHIGQQLLEDYDRWLPGWRQP